MTSRVVKIDYTNWQGKRRIRQIEPSHMWFGTTEWHKEPQWLLRARDMEDMSVKDFALAGIHAWGVKEPLSRDDELINRVEDVIQQVRKGDLWFTDVLDVRPTGLGKLAFTMYLQQNQFPRKE